jgi:hypothetical protein
MQHEKDYYQILGVSPKATSTEIRRSYRQLAILNHPDRNPSPQATLRMQDINEAYSVLGNKSQRIKYDTERVISRAESQTTSAPQNTTTATADLQQIFAEDATQRLGLFVPLAISKIVLGLSIGVLVGSLSQDWEVTMYVFSIIVLSSVSVGVIALLRWIKSDEIEAQCPKCKKVRAAVKLDEKRSNKVQKKHYRCRHCRYEWQFVETKGESIF